MNINVYNFWSNEMGPLCAVSGDIKECLDYPLGATFAFLTPYFDEAYFEEIKSVGEINRKFWLCNEKFVLSKALLSPCKYMGQDNMILLDALITPPKFRGKGLAKDVVEFCANRIDEKEFPTMQLYSSNDTSKAAERKNLYESWGFVPRTPESSYYVAPIEKLRSLDPNKFTPDKSLANIEITW